MALQWNQMHLKPVKLWKPLIKWIRLLSPDYLMLTLLFLQ